MKRRLLLAIWTLCGLPAAAANLDVYTDALVNGFQDYSFPAGEPNFSAITQVHSGTKAISWQPHDFSGLSFALQPPSILSTANYNALNFWIRCSSDCARPLNLSFQNGAALLNDVSLAGAYPGGVLPANQWTQITVSLDAGPWTLPANTSFDRFNLQGEAGTPATNFIYIDDVQLIARVAGAAIDPLVVTAGTVVNGVSGSTFTWIDGLGDPRSAHMATGTGGANKGGILNQFNYRLANGSTRTVNQSACCGAGGFGYIVSHLADASIANNQGEDDSPLGPPQGDNPGGATQTVFAGRHHALHMYTLNYPRWGLNAAMTPTKYNMAVKIGWVFATGRNHPLWTVTFDMNQMPTDAVVADTRAPYGDMNFDGTAGEGADGDVVGGVGWGDVYKFRSTTAPFTLNSGWTWNTANTIPHNMLWTQTIDSEMGIVLTQPITQQDAGGYFAQNKWTLTSANGSACPATPTVMPCDYAWPFQSINYSFFDQFGVLHPNDTTQSKRLAWGADFGYIGQTNYPDRSANANRSGYPYHSYSTYIVLDQHSRTPTDIQVSQMETRQLSTAGASVGTVAASGPAGLGRPDNITFQPAGFDPIFDAWTFVASGNNLTASLTTPAPYKLHNPLVILRSYTLMTEPAQVKIGGVALIADRDYYASAIPARNELWLTLRGQFQNTTSLEVIGVAAGGAPTLLAAQSRKIHGAAGTFELSIDRSQLINQAVTVEPRTIGGGHTIVFLFDQPIANAGTATTTIGTGVSATNVNAANEVVVTLTGVPDNQRATVSLSGVNGNGTAAVSLRFLVGDVNNTRSVNSSDISGVKARSGQTTTATNFQFDVNASGAINSSDISAVKARSGLTLP